MLGAGGEVILPGSFLPVAERYGLIGEIDRWVIGQAARRAAGGSRVEANLSARMQPFRLSVGEGGPDRLKIEVRGERPCPNPAGRVGSDP